jgi:hypothetical protein
MMLVVGSNWYVDRFSVDHRFIYLELFGLLFYLFVYILFFINYCDPTKNQVSWLNREENTWIMLPGPRISHCWDYWVIQIHEKKLFKRASFQISPPQIPNLVPPRPTIHLSQLIIALCGNLKQTLEQRIFGIELLQPWVTNK